MFPAIRSVNHLHILTRMLLSDRYRGAFMMEIHFRIS